jgi:uncharacterized protein YcbX
MTATVATISIAPVKGLALAHPDAVDIGPAGARGDRSFFLVDERGDMVSAPRLGALLQVTARHDEAAGMLRLTFPGPAVVEAPVELGAPEDVRFFRRAVRIRPVQGPFSAALSEHVGRPVRLMAAPEAGSAVDRGAHGAVTLLSLGSLDRLRREAGLAEPIDARRFRMLLALDGAGEHEEDAWMGRSLRIGEALLRVSGNVGRCVLTTRNPDSGRVDLLTLHVLRAYRDDVDGTEPLPFGVHAEVLEPGRVALGDPVALA